METNRDFLEKMGFKDITNDPIFDLKVEVEMKKNSNNYMCEICKKEISRIFSRDRFCKFCGCTLCDKCSNLRRKIMDKKESSTICMICDNKFKNFELHENFKTNLLNKEFEITEFSQKLEKLTLIYSDQLDEINKLNENILKKKRENEAKDEILNNEIESIKKKTIDICDVSEKTTKKINETINLLKSLDEKKNEMENKFKEIQNERENITFEQEKKQSYLDEVLARVNQISISMKNLEQNKKETGHKQLDMLLKEKMKSQKKVLEENKSQSQTDETTIILNPSKVIKEIYKEPLLTQSKINGENKNAFKRFILYMGKKIFINE